MTLNDNYIPGTFPTSSPTPLGGLRLDIGDLDMVVESAWTHNDQIIAGAERLHSERAEAPTSNQLSTDLWIGALGAPSKASTLQAIVDEATMSCHCIN
jgi:hypothetical protein